MINKIEGKDPVAEINGWNIVYTSPGIFVSKLETHILSKNINNNKFTIPGINTLNGAATFGGTESGNLITHFLAIKTQ